MIIKDRTHINGNNVSHVFWAINIHKSSHDPTQLDLCGPGVAKTPYFLPTGGHFETEHLYIGGVRTSSLG